MKKFVLVVISSLMFALLTTITLAARNLIQIPDNPTHDADTARPSDNDYLPALLEGYVRVVPFNGSVYIIRESEIETLEIIATDDGHWNTNCEAIFPSSHEDYYRILLTGGDTSLIHKDDMASFCNASNPENPAQTGYPSSDLTFCNDIEAYFPTNSEDYYRVLLRDGSVYIVPANELSILCDITI